MESSRPYKEVRGDSLALIKYRLEQEVEEMLGHKIRVEELRARALVFLNEQPDHKDAVSVGNRLLTMEADLNVVEYEIELRRKEYGEICSELGARYQGIR
jgi:hypothetical protein